VCVTHRVPPVRPGGRETLRVTHPSGARAPTSAHPRAHPDTADHEPAASRPGWPAGPAPPPPSPHQLTRTSGRATLRRTLVPPGDQGLMAPGWWAGRWASVSGRSPRPAHCVRRSHGGLRAERSRRIVPLRPPHRALESVVTSRQQLDCSARLRSLLYDYQKASFNGLMILAKLWLRASGGSKVYLSSHFRVMTMK